MTLVDHKSWNNNRQRCYDAKNYWAWIFKFRSKEKSRKSYWKTYTNRNRKLGLQYYLHLLQYTYFYMSRAILVCRRFFPKPIFSVHTLMTRSFKWFRFCISWTIPKTVLIWLYTIVADIFFKLLLWNNNSGHGLDYQHILIADINLLYTMWVADAT